MKTKDPNRYKKNINNNNNKNVNVNSNIREMKNSMARIKQNRRIALFSLRSFNQSQARKKKSMQKYLFNNILYDRQSIIRHCCFCLIKISTIFTVTLGVTQCRFTIQSD